MTQREVARALGISRSLVQIIEHRALCKVAIALNLPAPIDPPWLRGAGRAGTTNYCAACGDVGHNRRACTERDRAITIEQARAARNARDRRRKLRDKAA